MGWLLDPFTCHEEGDAVHHCHEDGDEYAAGVGEEEHSQAKAHVHEPQAQPHS